MKKLFVLALVLAMTQLSWAGLATLQVNSADVKTNYSPGDVITVEIVASYDTSLGGTDTTGSMSMDHVFATSGTALSTSINAGFDDLHTSGTVIGLTAPAIVGGVAGTTLTSSPDIASGAVLWSMQYKFAADASGTVEITADNYFSAATDFADPIFSDGINALDLQVVPEPMTMCLLGLGGLFLRRRSK
jgi:hypothetical protein